MIDETDRNLRRALAQVHMTFIQSQSQANKRGEAIRAIAALLEERTGTNPIEEFAKVHNRWFNTGEWEMEL